MTNEPAPRRKLLSRAERRAALIEGAKRAFVRGGFAATSLDEIAAAAGVSTVLIYRHFESKADLYRAVLDDVRDNINRGLPEGLTAENVDAATAARRIDHLISAAHTDPDGFRLLFRHAAREPEFRDRIDQRTAQMTASGRRLLAGRIADPARRAWAAALAPAVLIDAILTWIDAGCPDPENAADTVRAVTGGAIRAIAAAQPEPAPGAEA